MASKALVKSARTFVRSRSRRPRTDRELMQMMEAQARVLAGLERTRLSRGRSIEAFAFLAGVSERTYRRALSGLFLIRAATMAKLRAAQRKLAAEA